MAEKNDIELLRDYALRNSETAFATLVSRYINLVYSAALRQVGNHHQAEEITQVVFVVLARKAGSIGSGTILAGWLFRTARLTAANYLRTEIRRVHREQEAYMQSQPTEHAEDVWQQIAPVVNDVIADLGEKDRHAVVLKFLDGKAYRDVAAALGGTEAAAQMRVSRALEKLRKLFAKRGVVLSASTLGAALATHGIQAAPFGLAASSAAAAVNVTVMTASTLTLVKGTLKLMAWTKTKFAIGAGLVALLAFQYHNNFVQAQRSAAVNHVLELKNQTLVAQRNKIGQLERETAAILEVRQSQERDLQQLRTHRASAANPVRNGSSHNPTTLLVATLQDPDAAEALRNAMVNTFRMRWEPLIKTLNLSDGDFDRLVQSAGQWGMNNLTTIAEFTEGKITAEAAVQAETQNKHDRTNEIRSLLGERGFAEYEKCNEAVPARQLTEQLDRQLGTLSPFTPEQREQFAALIQAEPFPISRKLLGDFTVEDWVYPEKFKSRFEELEETDRRIYQKAVAFLTPDQLHELELMQANNLTTQKRHILRMMRKS